MRIAYRSCDADNGKPRPPFFSKSLALASLLRAAQALPEPPSIVFLNDGPIARERLAVMENFGDVRPIRKGGSASRTYREMLAVVADEPGPDHELIWFAEDDYLYLQDGLHRLSQAATARPDVNYFMIYGSKSLDIGRSDRHMAVLSEGGADHPDATVDEIDGVAWFRLASTTSTFGVRRGALREDVRLLRFCALTGGSWDSATCRSLQGFRPHRPGTLREDLLPFGKRPIGEWPKSVARGAVRALAIPLSMRSAARRRVLLGSDPEHALHMEAFTEPPHPITTRTSKIDWPSVAQDAAEWAREHGIPVHAPAIGGHSE